MAVFDFLKKFSSNIFVSENKMEDNLNGQSWATLKIMEQLRKYDEKDVEKRKLEFFFYTNTADKAEDFALELKKLNYDVEHSPSAGNKKLFIITGWTNLMNWNDEAITLWIKDMCELGYKFDCDFDGWGTFCE